MDTSMQQAVQSLQIPTQSNNIPAPTDPTSQTAQALQLLTPKKKRPQDMDNALSYQYALRQAQQNLSTSDFPAAIAQMKSTHPGSGSNNADYAGLCQAYAEQQTYGKTGIYPNAASAYQTYAQNGQTISAKDAKPGDLVYFQPDQSNGGAGHVGIYQGGGKMQSATYEGVKTSDIASWAKATGQKIAGYVNPH